MTRSDPSTFGLHLVSLHGGGGTRIARNFLRWTVAATDERWLSCVPRSFDLPTECAALPERYPHHAWLTGHWAWTRRLHFDNVEWPALMRAERARAMLSLTNVATLRPRVPHVLLVHDSHFVYPESEVFARMRPVEHARRALQMRLVGECIRGATEVVAQTQVMADRLRAQFPRQTGGKPVHVWPNSAFPIGAQRAPEAALPRAEGRDWLVPTQYYPHRNLEILLDVAERLARAQDRRLRFLVTVTPNDHAQAAGFLEAIARPRLAPYFENLGRRPPVEMPDLYARCVGVVQPSLLESLSFGYLEAMAHGRPTVASDFDFSRGTLADAALYAGAHDAGGFLDALLALTTESTTWERVAGAARTRWATLEAAAQPTFGRYVERLRALG